MDFTTHYPSPIGNITLASDGTALVGLWFEGQKHYAETLSAAFEERHDLSVFVQTRQWLDTYFSGMIPRFTPALNLRTSTFRRHVWEIMLAIPYGQTTTYGNIARLIAHKYDVRSMSAQAIGCAIAHNAISLIIPCHRVIAGNGSLTGYAGGLDRKKYLLQMESHFSVATNS